MYNYSIHYELQFIVFVLVVFFAFTAWFHLVFQYSRFFSGRSFVFLLLFLLYAHQQKSIIFPFSSESLMASKRLLLGHIIIVLQKLFTHTWQLYFAQLKFKSTLSVWRFRLCFRRILKLLLRLLKRNNVVVMLKTKGVKIKKYIFIFFNNKIKLIKTN